MFAAVECLFECLLAQHQHLLAEPSDFGLEEPVVDEVRQGLAAHESNRLFEVTCICKSFALVEIDANPSRIQSVPEALGLEYRVAGALQPWLDRSAQPTDVAVQRGVDLVGGAVGPEAVDQRIAADHLPTSQGERGEDHPLLLGAEGDRLSACLQGEGPEDPDLDSVHGHTQ